MSHRTSALVLSWGAMTTMVLGFVYHSGLSLGIGGVVLFAALGWYSIEVRYPRTVKVQVAYTKETVPQLPEPKSLEFDEWLTTPSDETYGEWAERAMDAERNRAKEAEAEKERLSVQKKFDESVERGRVKLAQRMAEAQARATQMGLQSPQRRQVQACPACGGMEFHKSVAQNMVWCAHCTLIQNRGY